MSPARRSAPVVLRLLGGLAPPLLLLLRPPAASGDCSLPPDVPNAQPALGSLTSFPKQSTVTYKCNEGFVKVPGKADTVVCLNNKWSEVAEFCNRSCDVPTRLLFASLKKSYTKQNYFPEGSTVEYDCRLGFIRNHSLSGKLTCLQNFTWSKPDEFCKKKSCANPREIKNGHVSITRDLLFGSSIHFSCNTGYKLVGATSSYCSLAGNTVDWSDPFPECQEILCPEPPEVDHGMIENEQSSYAYRQSVTYKCMKGFALHGESSIYCTVKDDQGEWSGPPPECKETFQIYKLTPAVQKPTRVHVPATKAPSSPQKSTTVNVSGTEAPPTFQKPSTVKVSVTEAPPTFQKPTTVKVSATEAPPTPQKPTTVKVSATEAPPTPQKPTTVKVSATEAPPTPQKPTTVKVSATEAPPTPQKPTTVKVSATEAPPPPQKPTTVNVPATEVSSAPQKPSTANDSATVAPNSPISNTVSTAAQNPIMANASASQATPTTQRFTKAKSSLTQNLRATQKSTAVHTPVTKSLHATQRLTSAHVTATRSPAVPRTTAHFHATSTPKGGGSSPSVASIIASGCVAGIIIIGTIILVKIFWGSGKSGSYYTHENHKALNVKFHNLTGDATEVRPSINLQQDIYV
ncbi:complement decay-accelerating factor isoform X2 [Physeter macrocephalus]|uniref:Complement decay-accelerating factor isoform X2 n=1 Tax=Physeter macrocephalus TaxID=9755 RepID=A0A2Y9TKI8_PHYMC|nr:complement decay-accelerating factor isoform X2 [Physeter catodon]|eukprot:XP_023989589.1 complement decay-accelerating factor isoform X2 [Physeter catodon]